jgi:hypothetical protein
MELPSRREILFTESKPSESSQSHPDRLKVLKLAKSSHDATMAKQPRQANKFFTYGLLVQGMAFEVTLLEQMFPDGFGAGTVASFSFPAKVSTQDNLKHLFHALCVLRVLCDRLAAQKTVENAKAFTKVFTAPTPVKPKTSSNNSNNSNNNNNSNNSNNSNSSSSSSNNNNSSSNSGGKPYSSQLVIQRGSTPSQLPPATMHVTPN